MGSLHDMSLPLRQRAWLQQTATALQFFNSNEELSSDSSTAMKINHREVRSCMRQNSLWQEAFKLAKPRIIFVSNTQGIRCMSDAQDSTSQASGSHRVDDGGERITLE